MPSKNNVLGLGPGVFSPEVTATPIAMDTDLMTTMYCWTMTSHFRKPRQLTVKTAPSCRSYVSSAVIEFPDKINLREKGSIWLQRETLCHRREKTWLQAEKAWGQGQELAGHITSTLRKLRMNGRGVRL